MTAGAAPTTPRIRTRLMRVLYALLAFWGVVVVVMLVQFQHLHTQVEQVTQQNLPRLKRANLLVDAANQTARLMGFMLLQPERVQPNLRQIYAVRAEVNEHLAWFHRHAATNTNDVALAQMEALRASYWRTQDTLFTLLQEQPNAALAYYLNVAIPLQRRYVSAIGHFLQLEDAATNASVTAIRSAYEQTLYGLLLLSAAAMLLAWGYGAWILRGVMAPMEQAVALAGDVAQGNLNAGMARPQTDEAGQLTWALARMVEALRIDRAQRQATEDALRLNQMQLRKLVAHAEAMQERERLALSRELHDGMGQLLTALRLELGAMRIRYAHLDEALAGQIDNAKGIIDQMLPTMRGVVAALRPGSLDAGLVPAVEWLISNLVQRAGIECKLLLPTGEPVLPAALEMTAFRVVQEALTNVVRHAQATQVSVTISLLDDEQLLLVVADNGIGMLPEDRGMAKHGFGLLGMRERALQYAGDVSISETTGGGTTLCVRLSITGVARVADQPTCSGTTFEIFEEVP